MSEKQEKGCNCGKDCHCLGADGICHCHDKN